MRPVGTAAERERAPERGGGGWSERGHAPESDPGAGHGRRRGPERDHVSAGDHAFERAHEAERAAEAERDRASEREQERASERAYGSEDAHGSEGAHGAERAYGSEDAYGAERARGAGFPSPLPLAHPPTSTSTSVANATPAANATSGAAPTTPVAPPASGATAPNTPASANAATGAPAPTATASASAVTGPEATTTASASATTAPTRSATSAEAVSATSGRSATGAETLSPVSARSATTPGTAAVASTPPAGGAAVGGQASGGASPDAILIRRTLDEIEPVADKVTSYFYALLFVHHPDLRALFPAAMDAQRDRLFKALLTSVKNVDDTDYLTEYLSHLGRGHRKYGTLPEHYPAVGESLLAALARYAPGTWHPEAEAAWVRAYTRISQLMIDAAAEDEAVAPAWWQAEVVSHELRTPDIAVVTVRPDQPYPFLAGQYTSVETPWWPRVWRHYSFAAAPRSDGLLSFHVKAVPAGWVSNAMVHRARPGDVIRLGPPSGSMTVDHTTDNGLLCLGGGTGIAPIKALIEDVAERGHRRPMEVFYGARSDHDLYDLDTMLRLEQSLPWLSVRPVVASGRPGGQANGLSGQLPDAVRQYGPWWEYDAYLSGPPGMIRNGVDALVGVGIPSDRIRHDSVEELVAAGG
ncbi:globin domain-containing protein [Streptomyces sp. NPDC059788]|uniref:globin domain-containing protein n=1 Tax=Streptomyces sp. NPDC059788 TaxID=3346948 RepID=UPI00366517DC